MDVKSKKDNLRIEFLKPKLTLKGERRRRQWTTDRVASLIGVSRRQYELKENGTYPFNDYEIYILAKAFDMEIGTLFFDK